MKIYDPAGIYSPDEVRAALEAQHGTRFITYRYDRLDYLNNLIGPLEDVISASVSNNSLSEVKRTAKLTLKENPGAIDYARDRVQPWARLAMLDGGHVEWALGVFLLASPERSIAMSGGVVRSVEAYDQNLVLRDDKIINRYSIPPGDLYTDAVETLLDGFVVNLVHSPLGLPSAKEWEPGTSKLAIVNDLLAALNYESLWFDEYGRAIVRPYQSPADRPAEYDYTTDDESLISGEVKDSTDLFSVPNRWVLVKSEADQAPITAVSTNTNAASMTSTVSRGRTITDFRTEQDAADLDTLQAKADRLRFEASQIYNVVTFPTLAMPVHSNGDVYSVTVDGLAVSAKFAETEWSLPLVPGATMTHSARRVVTV